MQHQGRTNAFFFENDVWEIKALSPYGHAARAFTRWELTRLRTRRGVWGFAVSSAERCGDPRLWMPHRNPK
ncbi:hypothetical protein NIES4073_37650 [Kalymmatonema gypsitolerans NIES-4073]|nr:hypothetical protein NIES4073_37650 [Scytonema sp. NIES-4073]